jgi:ribA/ribD-fused uncharacterized protein
MEKFTFFWGGEFSQWYPSRFMIGGVIYNCAEQYMMAKKADLFGDHEMWEKIMNSTSPREQKALGRGIANFNPEVWNANCKQFVKEANIAKFTQNNNLYDVLMSTVGTTLVEASPEDKIWGIGLAHDDPRAQNRATWEGTNWLGEIITEVRDELIKAQPEGIE